jgi:hypothetical protein
MNIRCRRTILSRMKCLPCIFFIILSIFVINYWFTDRIFNDGTYTLIPLKSRQSFKYALSRDLLISIDQKSMEDFFLNLQYQSRISTPYFSQLCPLAYVLRIDDRFYRLHYEFAPILDLFSYKLRHVTRTIPFVQHIPTNRTRPNRTIPLMPIPYGQRFQYKTEERLTFAVFRSNTTELYITSLQTRQLTRIRYEPLGLDQYQHHRWLFFTDDQSDRLLAITNLQPHVIVTVDIQTGIARDYARTSQSQLFSLLRGEPIFLGASPIRLPSQDLYLAVFHTATRKDLFYTFSSRYPYAIQCLMFESPFNMRRSQHPITDIRLYKDTIIASDEDEISLLQLFSHMEMQCTYRSTVPSAIILQWFPSVIPPSISMPPFIFNPAVLALPRHSLYPYLAVSRSSFHGAQHRIMHPSYQREFASEYWGIMLACLMDTFFTCIHIPQELHLYYPIEGIVQRYNRSMDFPHNFVGAEDPRLIWSETNAPLLMYGMNALENDNYSMTTRLVWIIDIRHVFQALTTVIPSSYSRVPFYTPEQGVQLTFQSTLWEKNWMAFIHRSHMMIGYSIEPKVTIVRRRTSTEGHKQRWFFDIAAVSQQGIHLLYPEKYYDDLFETVQNNERVFIDSMHQGPNALLIVGEKSSFYFTIIHQRVILYNRSMIYPHGFRIVHYMNYVALFDTETPYQWLAISRQFIDPIVSDQSSVHTRDRKFIFITTIAFADLDDIQRGCGTVDSRILVSYGMTDRLSYVWTGTISELMNNMRTL